MKHDMRASRLVELEKFGLDRWFQDRLDLDRLDTQAVARVVSVQKDSYLLSRGGDAVFAELTGKLLYAADSARDLPTTGDWVYADFYDDDSHAVIHDLIPRKTLLSRKSAGKSVGFQLIAANIDCAFILQSVDGNFNPRRLERYLVMVNESGITPVILLSKCDLVEPLALELAVAQTIQVASTERILPFSSESGHNLDTIRTLLAPGQTYCLLGSSGVGKTTLLNHLLGSDRFETAPVSRKENKGRHTTTSRELVPLANAALLIDTPGMRELGNLSVNTGLGETFSDIEALALQCRFANCRHTGEKGCALRAAIDAGELAEDRFRNYRKMTSEAAFNDMTYAERRQKDRNFGKMIKSTLKNKKR